MANTILNTPTYITAQELKANTSNPELAKVSDSIVNNLIIKAQITIDNYIWEVGDKNVAEQYFKFPITGSTEIPANITMATLYVTEAIYTNTIKSSWQELKAESWDGYSKSFKEGSNANFEVINGNVKNLLKEYGINKGNLNKAAFKLNY